MRWWWLAVVLCLVGCGGGARLAPRPAWTTHEPAGFATLTVDDVDGSLAVTSLEVEVEVRGRLAVTRVTQVFQNAMAQAVEGTFEMTLPPGATVTRLAMDVGGVMTEGEVVERERARAIYREVTTPRRRDPAIMESLSLERFRTRIFPIPARGTKTVVVEYEQLLPASVAGARYVYGLPRLVDGADGGGTAIGAFSFTLDSVGPHDSLVVGGYPARVERAAPDRLRASMAIDAFVPTGPLTVELSSTDAPELAPVVWTGTRTFAAPDRADERFFLADVVAGDVAARRELPEGLVVVLDTSASLKASESARSRALAGELVEAVGPEVLGVLVGATQVTRCLPVVDSTGRSLTDYAGCLDDQAPGGATDLGQLVEASIEAAVSMPVPTDVVVISDGWASLGELDRHALAARWESVLAGHEVTVHTVAVGAAPDEATLRVASGLTGGQHLRVPPGVEASEAARVLRELATRPAVTGIEARVVEGEVDGLYLSSEAVVAGDVVSVWGRQAELAAVIELSGWQGRVPWRQRIQLSAADSTSANPMALSHLWARSRITELASSPTGHEDIVALSRDYGVLSPYTALLVLENEAMYREHAVERREQAEHDAAIARGERGAWQDGAAVYDEDWHGLGEAAGVDVDSDGDRILDRDDACPLEPEDHNGLEDDDGCPDTTVRVIIPHSHIEVREWIYFEPGQSEILGRSESLLEVVADVLEDNPQVERVLLEGHADDREVRAGRAEALSLRRAEAVRDRLVELGVEPERLLVVGFGSERPIADPSSKDGRARNRRVGFEIARANGEWVGSQGRFIELESQAVRTPVEEAELVALYLEIGRADDADARYAQLSADHGDDPAVLAALFSQPGVQQRWADEFVASVRAAPEAFDEATRAAAYETLIAQGDGRGLSSLAVSVPLGVEARVRVLFHAAATYQVPTLAEHLYVNWSVGLTARERVMTLLGVRARGVELLSGDLVTELEAVFEAEGPDDALLAAALQLAAEHGELVRFGPWLQGWCTQATGDALEICIDWLEVHGAAAGLDASVLADARERRLAEVVAARVDAPGRPQLILRQVELLDALGRLDEARAVLTELVEYGPRRGQAHLELGRALLERGESEAACQALRNAVRLEASLQPLASELGQGCTFE